MDEKQTEQTLHQPSAKEFYGLYGGSVVAVVTRNLEGDEGVGSAFHVGDGFFVTAKHVVENKASCKIELDSYRLSRLAKEASRKIGDLTDELIPITAYMHPDDRKDVAVFSVPELAVLPAIPLGDHLDDFITDHDFILNEVLVLGFPPIPLSRKKVLVAARGQINAVIDLINIPHVHFVVSTTARGGFSGGVVLSEWGFALGLVTSSLLTNGAPEELGYLTVLTIEPILECLAAHGCLPRDLARIILEGLVMVAHPFGKLYFYAVDAKKRSFQEPHLTMKRFTPAAPVLSPVNGKPVPLNFDGAEMSSDADLALLREVERRHDMAGLLSSCLTDLRDPGKVRHSLEDIIRFRIMMIAAGYGDGNDAADPRHDPSFRIAPERNPETGAALCPQPTIPRMENLPDVRDPDGTQHGSFPLPILCACARADRAGHRRHF